MTISGIKTATASRGHRFVNRQFFAIIMAAVSVIGKAAEATIEARETYRHIKTTTSQVTIAKAAQIV